MVEPGDEPPFEIIRRDDSDGDEVGPAGRRSMRELEQMRRGLERRHSRAEHAVIRGTFRLITQASERTPHERVKPEQLTGQLTDCL